LALTVAAFALGVVIAIVFSFDIEHVGLEKVALSPSRGITMALTFVAGAVCSAVAGYMGMTVAVSANVRSAAAAATSLSGAFRVAFYAGSVMGLAMVGLATIGMSVIYLITGFSYGLVSIAPSIIGITVATLLSYYLAESSGMSGIYGLGISAVGMLSVSGMIVSSDAYGPIVDNARGIAEMAGMSREVIDTTACSMQPETRPRPSPKALPSARRHSPSWHFLPRTRR
jgi:Na+/H+-translocating membrane pyrophosphatase